MNKKVFAIVTAAGSGARFTGNLAGKTPKQFLLLKGLPVIMHSMLALQKNKYIYEILVAAENKYFEKIHSLAAKYKISKLTKIAEGGATRFESVKNAFENIENASASDLVLIHDAARPNISHDLLTRLISTGSEVIAGWPVTETVKKAKKGIVAETLERSNLWLIQTPQVFRYRVLKSSYAKLKGKQNFTDEASAVEHAGYKVKIIEGERGNVKITLPGDFEFLKKLM